MTKAAEKSYEWRTWLEILNFMNYKQGDTKNMLREIPRLTFSCPCFLQASAPGSPHLCGLPGLSFMDLEPVYSTLFMVLCFVLSHHSLTRGIFTRLLALRLSSPRKDQAFVCLFVHSFPPLSEPSITGCYCAKNCPEKRGMRAGERAPWPQRHS